MLQPTPRSRPPGPPGIPFSGHSWHFIRDPLRFLTVGKKVAQYL